MKSTTCWVKIWTKTTLDPMSAARKIEEALNGLADKVLVMPLREENDSIPKVEEWDKPGR